MSLRKPWEPKIERGAEFNPFTNVSADGDSSNQRSKLRNPAEDTAPLQGSRDLSDADSLEDVIADAYSEQPADVGTADVTGRGKV